MLNYRGEIERLIYAEIDKADPSGECTLAYRKKFSSMSDDEFMRFCYSVIDSNSDNALGIDVDKILGK